MTNSIYILLISLLFCTAATVLAIILKRSNNIKDLMLSEMKATLESLHNNKATSNEATTNFFDDNLRTAALTTRLQQPRLSMQQGGYSPATPERYHYIRLMVEKGMSVQEIADMLVMSLHETSQLVTLIRVADLQTQDNNQHLPSTAKTAAKVINGVGQKNATRPGMSNQKSCAGSTTIVKKSIKFARWLKGRTTTLYIRKQSGREPPPQPLPGYI